MPPRRESSLAEAIEAPLTLAPAGRGARLRPLLALAPYVARYRGQMNGCIRRATNGGIHRNRVEERSFRRSKHVGQLNDGGTP